MRRAATLLLVVGYCMSVLPAMAGVDDPASVRWAVSNYAKVADIVLGDPRAIDVGPTSSGAVWAAAVRCRPSYDAPEWQLVITEASSGRFTLSYHAPRDASIYQQMLEIHAAHAGWDSAQVAAQVRMRREVLEDASAQRMLREAAVKLSQIRVELRLPSILVTDVGAYRVWSLSGSQWIEMNILSDPSSNRAVIRWAEALRRDALKRVRKER